MIEKTSSNKKADAKSQSRGEKAPAPKKAANKKAANEKASAKSDPTEKINQTVDSFDAKCKTLKAEDPLLPLLCAGKTVPP
jgi:hypothetical protein